jgi:hypothetical protein
MARSDGEIAAIAEKFVASMGLNDLDLLQVSPPELSPGNERDVALLPREPTLVAVDVSMG